ncbi:MAG: hypothetical protein FWD39_00595 [Clostridiales bacterium]|nr:hypothetical protein [Clostridiales bacterium]
MNRRKKSDVRNREKLIQSFRLVWRMSGEKIARNLRYSGILNRLLTRQTRRRSLAVQAWPQEKLPPQIPGRENRFLISLPLKAKAFTVFAFSVLRIKIAAKHLDAS